MLITTDNCELIKTNDKYSQLTGEPVKVCLDPNQQWTLQIEYQCLNPSLS
jgi:hypothetical protein